MSHSEKRAYLAEIGADPSDFLLGSDSSSCSDSSCTETGISDDEDSKVLSAAQNDSVKREADSEKCIISEGIVQKNKNNPLAEAGQDGIDKYALTNNQNKRGNFRSSHRDSASPLKDGPRLDINSVVVLDILREADCNWFAFVVLLEEVFRTRNFSEEVLDQFLCDFAGQLDTLGLSEDEMKPTEQSRTA